MKYSNEKPFRRSRDLDELLQFQKYSDSSFFYFLIHSSQPYISPDAGRARVGLGTLVRNPSYTSTDFRFGIHLSFGPD
jgi:hypothetical protein